MRAVLREPTKLVCLFLHDNIAPLNSYSNLCFWQMEDVRLIWEEGLDVRRTGLLLQLCVSGDLRRSVISGVCIGMLPLEETDIDPAEPENPNSSSKMVLLFAFFGIVSWHSSGLFFLIRLSGRLCISSKKHFQDRHVSL